MSIRTSGHSKKCPHCDEWLVTPEQAKQQRKKARKFILTWTTIMLIVIFGSIGITSLVNSGNSKVLLENKQYDHTIISGMHVQYFTLKHNVTIDKIEVRIGSQVPGINRVTLKVFDWMNEIAKCSMDLSGYYPYAEDTNGNPSYGWVTFDFEDFRINANKNYKIMLSGSVYGEYLAQSSNSNWNYKIYGWKR